MLVYVDIIVFFIDVTVKSFSNIYEKLDVAETINSISTINY